MHASNSTDNQKKKKVMNNIINDNKQSHRLLMQFINSAPHTHILHNIPHDVERELNKKQCFC